MKSDAAKTDEVARILRLESLGLMEVHRDAILDSFVTATAEYCNTPIAFISVFHSDRQVLRSSIGLDVEDIPFEQSFCHRLFHNSATWLQIEDTAREDANLSDRFPTGVQRARFYAGHKLQTADGYIIGSLVVIDTVPRTLNPDQWQALKRLATVVSGILEQQQAKIYSDLDNIILRNISQGVMLIDPHLPDSPITYCNDALVSMTGFARAEMLGRSSYFLLGDPPDSAQVERLRLSRSKLEETTLQFDQTCKDGRTVCVEYTNQPIADQRGAVRFHVTIVTDITKQKSAAMALEHAQRTLEQQVAERTAELETANRGLREIQDNLQQLLNVTPDATIIVSANGTINSINAQTEALFGYLKAELIGQKIEYLVPEPDRLQHQKERQAYLKRPRERAMGTDLNLRALHKKGYEIPVDINLSPITIGQEPYVVASVRDISEHVQRRKMLEMERKRADEANTGKTRFLATVSHDLRQPLQSLGLYLSVLERTVNDTEALQTSKKMRLSLDAMTEMLDALLDVSRLESGNITPELTDFPVQPLFDRLSADFQPTAQKKNLSLAIAASNIWLHSDPTLLQRILHNLVANAIKYTEHGTVSVSCTVENEHASLSIIDTGIGIPFKDQERVFDEYIQLTNSERDRSQGLGLGLAIVRSALRLLNMPFHLESGAGEGTRFSISVPLAKTTLHATHSSGTTPLLTLDENTKLLLVDDDESIIDAFNTRLQLEKIQAESAGTYRKAMEAVEKGYVPDVIITDYRLPDNNGLQLIEDIRAAAGKELPALLITGDTTLSNPQIAKMKYLRVLYKPLTAERFFKVLQELATE